MSAAWFRSWHGAPTDPKWRTVARRAGVRPGDVTAIVWTLLDRASQADQRGSIAGYDAEVIADALGYEPAEVEAVIGALHEKAVLRDNRFTGWEKHQPAREDGSAERAKAWRERKKVEKSTTEQERTHANACERNQPLDTDTEKKVAVGSSARRARDRDPLKDALVEAMGPLAHCAEKYANFHIVSEPLNWLASDCDLENDILPAIKAKCLKMAEKGQEPKGWMLFAEDVFKARDRRLAPSPPVQQRAAGPPTDRRNKRISPLDAAERIKARERAKTEFDHSAVRRLPADDR